MKRLIALRASAILLLVGCCGAVQGQSIEYVHTDALGSVVAISDGAGQVTQRREYEPYGFQMTPAIENGPGFTGHVQDALTELTYMQQRYYDPSLGLFLSADPVVAYSNPIAHFNRYRYADNNPYRFTDPDGRQSCDGTTCNLTNTDQFPAFLAIRAASDVAELSKMLFPIVPILIQASKGEAPPLPEGLVGTDDRSGSRSRGRENRGPLSPDNGGVGDADSDFDLLTGGKSFKPPSGSSLPEGSRVGENGILIRPGKEGEGPRIDIPASGDKPRETLHYPKKG